MSKIRDIIRARDYAREAEAARFATVALQALRAADFQSWIIGSLARGCFRQHSDIGRTLQACVGQPIRGLALS